MRVVVFGATGAIGERVVAAASAAGHAVSVFVRDVVGAPAVAGLDVFVGELTDADAVARAVSVSEAVVWAVGPTSNTPDQPAFFETAARTLVGAMSKAGVRRLVALSGAGVTVAAERKPPLGRLVSALVARVVPHVVEAKRREYEVFSRSGLDWTLVRPPRVTDGEATGRYQAGPRLRGRRISRGDLAAFIVDQLADETYVRQAPYVSS